MAETKQQQYSVNPFTSIPLTQLKRKYSSSDSSEDSYDSDDSSDNNYYNYPPAKSCAVAPSDWQSVKNLSSHVGSILSVCNRGTVARPDISVPISPQIDQMEIKIQDEEKIEHQPEHPHDDQTQQTPYRKSKLLLDRETWLTRLETNSYSQRLLQTNLTGCKIVPQLVESKTAEVPLREFIHSKTQGCTSAMHYPANKIALFPPVLQQTIHQVEEKFQQSISKISLLGGCTIGAEVNLWEKSHMNQSTDRCILALNDYSLIHCESEETIPVIPSKTASRRRGKNNRRKVNPSLVEPKHASYSLLLCRGSLLFIPAKQLNELRKLEVPALPNVETDYDLIEDDVVRVGFRRQLINMFIVFEFSRQKQPVTISR